MLFCSSSRHLSNRGPQLHDLRHPLSALHRSLQSVVFSVKADIRKGRTLINFADRIDNTALASSYLITTRAFIALGTLTHAGRLLGSTKHLAQEHVDETSSRDHRRQSRRRDGSCSQSPTTNPLVMVNLMQVRPHAEYDDPALNDCTGLEAFARYTSGSAEVRKEVGAELVWSGRAIQMPIGGRPRRLGTWWP